MQRVLASFYRGGHRRRLCHVSSVEILASPRARRSPSSDPTGGAGAIRRPSTRESERRSLGPAPATTLAACRSAPGRRGSRGARTRRDHLGHRLLLRAMRADVTFCTPVQGISALLAAERPELLEHVLWRRLSRLDWSKRAAPPPNARSTPYRALPERAPPKRPRPRPQKDRRRALLGDLRRRGRGRGSPVGVVLSGLAPRSWSSRVRGEVDGSPFASHPAARIRGAGRCGAKGRGDPWSARR